LSRIKIKQAAEILGVSEKTIRRRISKGQIQATKGKTPQGFIYLIDVNDDINSTSHDSTKFKNKANESNPPNNVLDMELLKKQFDLKDQQIESQKTQIESQMNQINELYKIIPKLESDINKISDRSPWWKFWAA
tara:strand:+ start:6692 stop:7093 length:402 start_codon:yes stop_codon:yes gene_type:complete